VVKKPVVFVPYPYAAEDHQTANAKQLVNKHAAMMIKDNEVKEKLVETVIALSKDDDKQKDLKNNIAAMAVTNADTIIANAIINDL
jgi:UDP-N-acetylglucosamine--N-acetylmuramyl-(pentapeptide) pyrophosphoryl-undecaprenol N-acetylglucosamine transferase